MPLISSGIDKDWHQDWQMSMSVWFQIYLFIIPIFSTSVLGNFSRLLELGCEDFRISNRTTKRRQEWPPNLHPWESATLSDLAFSGVLAILVFRPPAPIWLILTQLTTDEWVPKMYRQVKSRPFKLLIKSFHIIKAVFCMIFAWLNCHLFVSYTKTRFYLFTDLTKLEKP